MDKPISKVIKSRSSNSAIKEEKPRLQPDRNKKSKSNAEIKVLSPKRRGYIDKRNNRVSLNTPTEAKIDETQPVKPPPRPKLGSKQFLDSVLAILSKSTTGTQYPDAVDVSIEPITNLKKKHNFTELPAENEKRKKPKYRSKVLNDNKYQIDNFEVLQSRKEIIQTPSLYSERSYKEDNKCSELPRLVKVEHETNNIVKVVEEGRKVKAKKNKVVDPDPATLVSEHIELKQDKQIYNFFVDLLETTFSVYNVKTDYETAPIPSAISSKISFEMDESVARKLNVATEMLDYVSQKPPKHNCSIEHEQETWDNDKLIDYFLPMPQKQSHELPLKTPTKRRRLKTKAFTVPKKSNNVPQTQGVVMNERKPFYKKNNKKNLLNILKEQLKMDLHTYEDPQNLYQALRLMAKRKAKSIRFDASAKRTSTYSDCMLRRRKIISSKKVSKYDRDPLPTNFSEGFKTLAESEYTTETEQSNHSLAVYGFDYEVPKKRVTDRGVEKELILAYHSSPSVSDCVNDQLKFDTTDSSTTRDFSQIDI